MGLSSPFRERLAFRPASSAAVRTAPTAAAWSFRRWLRRGQVGQSLVEFALVLPVFLLIVLGCIDFGWAMRAYITATNSAREGARLGVTGATAAQITTKTVDSSSGLLTSGNVQVTGAQGLSGSPVEVKVTYDYHYITPLGGLLSALSLGALPDPLPVSSKTSMRLE